MYTVYYSIGYQETVELRADYSVMSGIEEVSEGEVRLVVDVGLPTHGSC